MPIQEKVSGSSTWCRDNEPSGKCGKPLLFGDVDIEVQKYVLALRKAGTPDIVIAAAKGIVTTKDQTMLAENGGSIHLTKMWAASLMERMAFVK